MSFATVDIQSKIEILAEQEAINFVKKHRYFAEEELIVKGYKVFCKDEFGFIIYRLNTDEGSHFLLTKRANAGDLQKLSLMYVKGLQANEQLDYVLKGKEGKK